MTDLAATLAAIDELAVDECGQCRRPLRADSASLDFCGPWCQEEWLRAKQEVVELVGYREPWDLPQHVGNLVELESPETTPPDFDMWSGLQLVRDPRHAVTYRLEVNLEPMRAAFEAMAAASVRALVNIQAAWESMAPSFVVFDEIHQWRWEPDPEPALPPLGEEPFGADFDFEWRPARTLPDAPLPAPQRLQPEPDWQAPADAGSRTGPSARPFERRRS